LVALGLIFVCAAQVALSRGGRSPPPCRSAEGAPFAVFFLIVWAWSAAQGAAALFSQTLDAGLVPAALLPAFGALASLQFVGVTLSPACYAALPFQGFWASLALACGALVGMGASAAALPRAAPGGRCSWALRAALTLSALVFVVGYGAYVSASVTVLTCRLASPMSVADYVRAASDGRALAEALRGAAPPLATLRSAVDDPFFAQRAGVAALLRTAIPVSVLATDPFTVCREGAHGAAWPAAAALTSVLLCAPALGLWALWGAGRLKGVRRALSRRAGVSTTPPLAPPRPVPLHLTGALVDTSLRRPFAWLTFYHMLISALCSGGVALSQRAASPAQFVGLQVGIIAATLGSAILVARARPFLERERWRGPVQVALYVLAGASAAVNLVMRFAGAATAQGPLGWCLAVPLLVLAGVAFALLFGGWWWALAARARSAGVIRATALGPAVDGWLPVRDDDGDAFWVVEATGAAEWRHPVTGKEAAPAWGTGAAERYLRAHAAIAVQRIVRGHLARNTVRGWVKVRDGSDVFFYNVASKESRWRPPWRRA
jgi:hypothetical protein